MGKRIINVSNNFFEVGGRDGDVMYNFRGNYGIKRDSVLYNKTVNLSDMYDKMLWDVREFLFGGEFISIVDKSSGITPIVNAYIFKKYGITMESVYNKMYGNVKDVTMTVDMLFNELKVKYGIDGIEWMYLYDNMSQFITNDVEILEYMSNRILSNDIYDYFVTKYNLRTVGVVNKVKRYIDRNNVSVDKSNKCIKIEWNNGGSRYMSLSRFVRSYKQWWRNMTTQSDKKRCNIKDYELLIEGRSVTEVFPVYCPVFSNLRLNYTGIDFDGKNNIKKCSEVAGYSERGETWSLASIDRIDSNKGYSYDNIRIISHYANHLKNVGSIEQLRMLLKYMDDNHGYF